MKAQRPEWTQHKVGRPSDNPKWINDDCKPFETVSHITHLPFASRIVEDKKILACLVFGRSRLNAKRILVSWFSPNTWHRGYRYGNVRFTFEFEELLKGRTAYWVETVPYDVPACRILLSSKDYSSSRVLFPYDQTKATGPWWYDANAGVHYRNGNVALEFMLEDDVSIDQSELDIVDHHGNYCSLSPKPCNFKGKSSDDASARFVAACLARGLQNALRSWVKTKEDKKLPGRILKSALEQLKDDLYEEFENQARSGRLTFKNQEAVPIAFYLLSQYAEYKVFGPYCTLFASKEDLFNACARLVWKQLKLSDFQPVRTP